MAKITKPFIPNNDMIQMHKYTKLILIDNTHGAIIVLYISINDIIIIITHMRIK